MSIPSPIHTALSQARLLTCLWFGAVAPIVLPRPGLCKWTLLSLVGLSHQGPVESLGRDSLCRAYLATLHCRCFSRIRACVGLWDTQMKQALSLPSEVLQLRKRQTHI